MLVLDVAYTRESETESPVTVNRSIECYAFDYADNKLSLYLKPIDSFRRKPNRVINNVIQILAIGTE